MPGKRRFGISIPDQLAEEVDRLAQALGVSRSTLITEALETYVDLKRHLVSPHECQGVMVLVSNHDVNTSSPHMDIVHEFNDIVKGHLHVHLESACVNVLIVKGPSERIAMLEAKLRRSLRGCKVYYVPLGGGLG